MCGDHSSEAVEVSAELGAMGATVRLRVEVLLATPDPACRGVHWDFTIEQPTANRDGT